MSIKAQVEELKRLNAEIKRLNAHVKSLRTQAKGVRKGIIEYITEKDLPGVKYDGVAVVLDNKPKRAPKKPKERDEDAIQVLIDNDVPDPEKVLRRILEARKGELVDNRDIKITKY